MKISFILQYLILIFITIIISIFTIKFYSLFENNNKKLYISLYYLSIINICFTIICTITLLFDSYIKYAIFLIYIYGCLTMLLIYNIIYFFHKEIENYNNDNNKFFIIFVIIPIYTILWYNIISSGSDYIKYKELITYIRTYTQIILEDDILKFHDFKYDNANNIANKLYNLFINKEVNSNNLKEILKKILFLNN